MLNNSDSVGGAAKAAFRLNDIMNQSGVESLLLVREKNSKNKRVVLVNGRFNKIINRIRVHLEFLPLKFFPDRKRNIFSSSIVPDNLIKIIKKNNPDIVHIHWIGSGFMKLENLQKINKPIVWTLHDSWPFTGGCHVPFDCKKYQIHCSKCPALNSSRENDLSKYVWQRKKDIYKNINLTIVSPSNWMASCARFSSLLGNKNIVVIHNSIDENIFFRIDKDKAREFFELDKNKKYILFSGDINDDNKGFNYLLDSYNLIKKEINNLEILVIGNNKEKIIEGVKFIGNIGDEKILNMIYNAVDIVSIPSIQENFSNTAIESLASGTPILCFDIGGMSDIVKQKDNGYLATPFDISDFSNGIKYILSNSFLIDSKSIFDKKFQFEEYKKLYENILMK